MPLLRVASLCVLLVALLCIFLIREATAQIDDILLDLGARAMAFPGSPVTDVRTVRINGVEVSLRTQVVDAALPDVLRHYRNECAAERAGVSPYAGLLSSLATRTRSSEKEGYVACIDIDAGDLETLTYGLARFSETWDLSDVGPLRYAFVRRAAERPEERTFLLTMWADSSVNLRALVPRGDDDARGSDLPGLPRPRNAQRILSATEASEPAGVFVYLARDASPADIERRYREALPEGGWAIVERNPGEAVEVDGVRILSAARGHRMVTVLAHAGDAGRTVATFLASEVDE